MKDLVKESYDNRKGNFFGPEKALKKIEAEKALAKTVHDTTNPRKISSSFFIPRHLSSVQQQGEPMPVQAIQPQRQEGSLSTQEPAHRQRK